MPSRIEDYALIGDCQTAALVARDGSIDWLGFPRFDSAACFAALLGTPDHGRWQVAPVGGLRATRRSYREGSLVLETEFETEDGIVLLTDFMPIRDRAANLVRIVEGKRGRVPMRSEFVLRPDYGSIVPWVRLQDDGVLAVAGPESFRLRTQVLLRGEGFTTVADFTIAEGERVTFDLTWFLSHEALPPPLDVEAALARTDEFWRAWSQKCTVRGEWRDAVVRSLVTLKALTYEPTGGIVAAPTTSLPEHLGGVRNWDYRYCWLRDATFTLLALLRSGYVDEARAWREWLLRAVAGRPSQLSVMYGVAGERRLPESELPWLPGYEGASPVRVGNGAYSQRQLDVFGEVMDAMHQCWRVGLVSGNDAWAVERALLEFLEGEWEKPDEGIWEIRGPRQHFTHSKVMAWVAMDRAVKGVTSFGFDGPVDRWRAVRDRIHAQVCREGYNPDLGSFVQTYGSKELDASLLMVPLVGFLPPTDPRVRGTAEAIERYLTRDGLVERYRTTTGVDGLPAGEGTFLLCSFWLADNLALLGRREDARRLFLRLLDLRNDVGLLSEGYDVRTKRLVGNFPQAFSHIGLINTARYLEEPDGQDQNARHRG